MLLPELSGDEFESIPIITGVCLLFYNVAPTFAVVGFIAAYMLGFYLFDLAQENLIARNQQLNQDKDEEEISISKSTLLGVWVIGALNPEETEWSKFQVYSVKVMLLSLFLVVITNLLILLSSFITIISINLTKTSINFILVLSTVFQSSILISNIGGAVYSFIRNEVDPEYRENMKEMREMLVN